MALYKFGDKLAEDYYGRDILIGSVVDEVEYYNLKSHVRRSIVVGLTGGGNLRVMYLGEDYKSKDPRASLGWLPTYKASLAPDNTLAQHVHVGVVRVNEYHNLGPNGFNMEYAFAREVGFLSKSERKTAGIQL